MPEGLYSALHRVAIEHPDRAACVVLDRHFDERVSFAELDRRILAVSGALAERGLGRGDRLAIWLPNLPEWLVLQLAASRLGVTVLSINTKYRVEELSHLLSLARPRALAFAPGFLGIDFAGTLEEALADIEDEQLELTIAVRGPAARAGAREGVGFEELTRSSPSSVPATPEPSDALAVLFPTSGTTSLPKLAAHDHAALVHHSANAAARLGLDDESALLCPLPLCGVFGYNAIFAALLSGATSLTQASFSGSHAAELGERGGATHFIGTDPMLAALIAAGGPMSLRRGIVSVTGDHPQRLIEAAEDKLDVRLTDVYGSSECFALTAFWPRSASPEMRAIKGGRLLPGIEARVVDPESRCELGPGERGELLFRGYNVLPCYLGNPEATDRALDDEGWYRTGDLGYLDADGNLIFMSRLDDSLRLRGFLVNPGEIEALLEHHPAVAAAQVVGVKDERGCDLPVAFVIQSDSASASAEDLQAFCRERAASYKVPEWIWFVDDFPRTLPTNGAKVQRKVLRERARALIGSLRTA